MICTTLTALTGLFLYFENAKSCNGPGLVDMLPLLADIHRQGFQQVVETLSDKYGPVFSFGPATIVTGNAKNVDTVMLNSKLPFVPLGLPRDAGMSSDDPSVFLQGRKALLQVGSDKQKSAAIIETIAPEVKGIMKEAAQVLGKPFHKKGAVVPFRETILAPIASSANSEFIFGISSTTKPARTKVFSELLQKLSFDMSHYFGATGILGTLTNPWQTIQAVKTSTNYLEELEQAVSDATLPPECPLSQVKGALERGLIQKTDALQFASSFLYTGVEAVEIVSEAVLWILAHPEHVEIQKECRQEVDSVLGGPNQVIDRADQLEQCHLLRAVLAESFRLNEIAMPFCAMRDFSIGDKQIKLKKGSFILVTKFNHLERSTATGRKEWKASSSSLSKFNPKVWLDQDGHFDDKLFAKFRFFGRGVRVL